MTDLTKCNVTFTLPDYESRAAMLMLIQAITGQHGEDFIRDVSQNPGGRFDELYEEDVTWKINQRKQRL